MISDAVAAVLVLVGSLFMLLAAVGVLRMPDVYMRISAATKAATLGAGCVLVANAVYFGDLGVATRALAILAFILITTPVGGHILGRAAYVTKTPLWEGTIVDELQGRYDALSGHPASESNESSPSARHAPPGGTSSK